MTGSDASPGGEPRETLKRLSAVLIRLHRALIQAEAKEFGAVEGPYQLLSLVSRHPHFAWLHGFTKLIVAIDEARSPKGSIGPGAVAGFADAARSLSGGEGALDADGRYAVLLERHADVAREHEELRALLDGMPRA
jgi:hypothetical protein